jgi:DNA-binding IclR family transcriptional regulator
VDERGDIQSTAGEDAAMESALLQQVLALHPTTITLEELTRELEEPRDDVDRAVRDLVATGLLHCSESLVLPSRAALRFDELMER